jgi:hypothetical protein
VVAGLLALAVTVSLAIIGIAPDGGHVWIDAIQSAIRSAASSVHNPTGGHVWID